VWRWDQAEPFGNNPADEDPDANSVAFDLPLRLPGQRYDAETALHYNYFRDYDPTIGRYGESDLIGLRGGLNTYAYVNGRPLSAIDLRGLFSADVHFKITVLSTQGLDCKKIGHLSLAWKTMMADRGTQSPEDAHRHSMCEPFIPYAGYCESKIDIFIESELAKCSIEGLANALHATQDGFASGHGGTEPWGGGWPGWGHIAGDKWPSRETRGKAVDASRALIDRFVKRCGCCEESARK